MFTVVGRNDADVVHGFVKQRHVLLVLDDLYGVKCGGLIESARNSGQMASRLGILISALHAVQSFGFGFRRVFVSGWRWAASGATAPPPLRATACAAKIRPVQRADEQALKSAGALQPKPLKIRASAGKSGESCAGRIRWNSRRLCCRRL